MKYLFDNCISPRFAAMLRALEVDAMALREEHAQDIKDVPLFRLLAGQDVIWVTTDTKQKTRIGEARALKDAGITALFFGPFFPKKQFWDQAVWVVRQWPKIEQFAEEAPQGTCAEIRHNGKALIYPL